jgi:hypothetical protein
MHSRTINGATTRQFAKQWEGKMVATNRTIVTLAIIVLGFIFMSIGASIERGTWYGVQWSTFITNLGIFLTVVVRLQ